MNYIDLAKKAAREAATIHKKYFEQELAIETKGQSFDRVTAADVEGEAAIVKCIRAHYPDHNFLGEEDSYEQTDSEYQWIIDPLDGTNNFSHRMPIFSVSIALAKNGEVIVGVVYDVMRDEMFAAEKGKGATLNDKPIKVAGEERLNQALLITGFYYDRGQDMIDNLECIRRFFDEHIIGLRRLGSAALDLCYIACGRATGYWEFLLSPWDMAAGNLIAEEAGGTVTNREGNPVPLAKSFVVASNGNIHSQMLAIINAGK